MATTTGCSGRLDPHTAKGLRAAREALRWSYRRAAREVGTTAGYLHMLDHGCRRPSYTVALAIIDAYRLDPWLARDLLDQAVTDAGRDSPLRDMENAPRRRRAW